MASHSGSPASGSVLEDLNEYDWSNPSNEYDADLNAYLSTTHNTTSAQDAPHRTQRADSVQNDHNISDSKETRGNSILRESAHETLLRLSNQFPPVIEEGADTLVWLGEPPKQPGQDDYEYGFIRRQFQMPYLMKSETLRRLNSPKFDKFLGPMSARTERRLKKHAIHRLVRSTANIKYYVDLSPVLNDEEAMVQLSKLTVPSGALAWHQKAQAYNVNIDLVCGRDDLDIPPRPSHSYRYNDEDMHESEIETLEEKLDSIADKLKANEMSIDEEKKKRRRVNKREVDPYNNPIEEEYTQLRHHTAIARLLHAVTGSDPKLNSAAKAWTFCMLADYFECASNSAVSHWVVSWILQTANNNFIQANPDIAYHMAIATQSGWLVKCTFAILVGQQAMVKGVKSIASSAQISRKYDYHALSCLDDDEINRIDHAAEVFSRRMKATLDEIVLFPGIWTFSDFGCVQLSRLRELETTTQEGQKCLDTVKDQLRDYARRVIYMTFSDAYPFDNKSVTPFRASEMFSSYGQVPRSSRILTQFQWEILRHEELYRDYLDTPNNHAIWSATLAALSRDGLLGFTHIPYVAKQTLYNSIQHLNTLISSGEVKIPSAKGPGSGGKRGGPEQSYATLQLDSPTKRTRFATSIEAPLPAPSDPVSLPRETGQGPDRELAIDSSQTKRYVEDDESDTTEEDWEVLEPFANDRKATRFLPIRPKSILKGAPTSSASVPPTTPTATEQRPTTSSGISSKFQGMGISSNSVDDDDWESTTLADRTRKSRSLYPKAPLTSDQRITDHVLSSIDVTLNQPTLEKTIHPPPSISNLTSPARWPTETSSDVVAASPFTWRPKPNITDPIAKENVWVDTDAISPEGLLRDLSRILSNKLNPLLTPGYVADGSFDFDVPVNNINTLLCLSEEEYKYLPLWAGGFDDGSGGVFDDGAEVPDAPDVADGGFRGGAMGIIPGVGSSMGGSMAGSEFEDLGTEVGISTVGKASRYATDGTATETVMSLEE